MPEMMSTDRALLDALLDDTVLAHIGFISDAHPVVIPTGICRIGDRVLAHGSTGSRWMRLLATGIPVSVSIATVDGIVVARSAFESSLHYRSAVLFGSFSPVEGDGKLAALDAFTERLLPGRTREVRPSSKKELVATSMLALTIDSWSLRISDGWPEDPEHDLASDAWAGVVPIERHAAHAKAAPDLRQGIAVPPSVERLATEPPRL
ncbi:pyridoxamine 5'-phosphate oxidase family protein [Naasia lichenicola]|uniref:Pyridoxamine 5'-phosphate oxidase family protein n=2 Tax=Naasia lichenicola TaxID=2565933 RepID=A0A4S4FU99_9MICO|nr:pyridoxamine 5'-phosphate oxidase family protein [Naasia lichenicola]